MIWAFFTGSPSSTVRSISLPEILKAILTCVSSMLPEMRMRLSGWLRLRNASVPAIPRATITTIQINFFDITILRLLQEALQRSGGLAQIDARLFVVVERRRLVVACAGEPRLRVGYFEARGDACIHTAARLSQLVL